MEREQADHLAPVLIRQGVEEPAEATCRVYTDT
jgi:hypothetical protein